MASRQSSSSSSLVVDPPPVPVVPVQEETTATTRRFFPVHRIYCVARNYSEHAMEMGGDPTRESPFFFTKPADAIVPCLPNLGATIGYPLATQNLHHEIELVVALEKGGVHIDKDDAMDHVYGFAVGVDLTRRDLQTEAKKAGRPWDSAKAFDQSAPISAIVPKAYAPASITTTTMENDAENYESPRIWLTVQPRSSPRNQSTENVPQPQEQLRQEGTISQMTWNIAEVISFLSEQYYLQPGDLLFTGTPAGVGPLEKGDYVRGGIDGLAQLEFTIVE